MPETSESGGDAVTAPHLERLPLERITDPLLPVRASMSDEKMDDLKDSMRALGLLEPILVVSCADGYEVVAGHRRLMAARELNWSKVPCLVFDAKGIQVEAARVHENAIREDVNPAEEAVYFQQLLDLYKLDEAGLMKLVRRGPAYIAERLRLLRGYPQVLEALQQGKIVFAVARVLNRLVNPEDVNYYLAQAVAAGTSSRVVEQWVAAANLNYRPTKGGAEPEAAPAAAAAPAPSLSDVESVPLECHYCGGTRDPWNLKWIQVHGHCQASVDEAIKKAGRGDG